MPDSQFELNAPVPMESSSPRLEDPLHTLTVVLPLIFSPPTKVEKSLSPHRFLTICSQPEAKKSLIYLANGLHAVADVFKRDGLWSFTTVEVQQMLKTGGQ